MKNKILFLSLIVFFIALIPQIDAYSYFNTSYAQRYNLTINASYGAIMTVNITGTTCAAKPNSTNLVYEGTPAFYPFEWGQGQANVSLEIIEFIYNLKGYSVGNYSLYCNMTDGKERWSNTTVFLFKDNFNDGLVNPSFYSGDATATESGGQLSLAGTNKYWSTVKTFSPGYAIDNGLYFTTKFNTNIAVNPIFGIYQTPVDFGYSFRAAASAFKAYVESVRLDLGIISTQNDIIAGIARNGTIRNDTYWYVNNTGGGAAPKRDANTTFMYDNLKISFYLQSATASTWDYLYLSNYKFNVTYVWDGVYTVGAKEEPSSAAVNLIAITLKGPENNFKTNLYPRELNYNFTVYALNGTLTNCTLYTNETGSEAMHGFITNPVNNSVNNITNNISSADVEKAVGWNIGCCMDNGYCARSSNFSFLVDITSPTLEIGGNNFFNSSNTSVINNVQKSNLRLNFTFTDNIDLYAFEVFIKDKNGNVVYNNTNISLSGTTVRYSANFTLNSTIEGNHTVNITVWDSHTAQAISDMDVKIKKDGIIFDDKISITAEGAKKASTKKIKDRYTFSFSYDDVIPTKTFYLESNSDLVVVKTSGYKAHFVDYINKKWIDFEGMEGNPTIEKINDKKYKLTFEDSRKELEINSIGGLNYAENFYSFYLSSPGTQWVFPPSTPYNSLFVNNSQTFRLNVTSNYKNHTIFYLYNSTGANIENKTIYSQNDSIYNATFTGLTDKYYYVNATTYDSLGGFTKADQVLVSRTIFDNCTDAKSVVLNFSYFDESHTTNKLVASVETDGYYFTDDPSSVVYFNFKYAEQNYTEMCLFINPDRNITINLYYKYTTPSGFVNRYYLINYNISNQTNAITLYNSNTTSGYSSLRITARDIETYNYYPNIYTKLQRYYPGEGIYRVVQMDKSGDYGLLVFNIIEEDQDYNLIFMDDNGRVLKSTSNMKFSCTSGVCDLTYLLRAFQEGTTASTSLTYNAYYNNQTNNITVTWSDPLGTTSSFRVEVLKDNQNPPQVICNIQTNASSGTIICPLGSTEGSVTLNLYSSSSPFLRIASFVIDILKADLEDFLPGKRKEAMMWTGMIVLITSMFAIYSPVALIIGSILGLVISNVLGISSIITTSILIIFGFMGIALSFILRD